jgi:hypothetical protein
VKVLALLIVLAGLVIAIVPQSTNCEAGGDTASAAPDRSLTAAAPSAGEPASLFVSMKTVATDTIVPKMKCFWSARGGLVVGITLAVAGGLLFFARRRETRRALAIVSALLGLFAILLPTSLIGTCGAETMICNTTMKPVMMIAGGIALAASVAALVVNELRRDEPDQTAAAV